MHPHHLRRPLNRLRPSHPPLNKLLNLRSQPPLRQPQIIHRPRPQYRQSRKPFSTSIHQCPTSFAEIVFHGGGGADGLGFAEGGEGFGAADVFEVGGEDGDVGLVEGGADFAAVCAVADVAVY